MELLWAAASLARVHEHHGAVLAKQVPTAVAPSAEAKERRAKLAELRAKLKKPGLTERQQGALLQQIMALEATRKRDVVGGVLKTAQANLDEFVDQSKRSDETTEQAHLRLSREDARYGSLYAAYDEVRRLATG